MREHENPKIVNIRKSLFVNAYMMAALVIIVFAVKSLLANGEHAHQNRSQECCRTGETSETS
jgi:hypothetical protein